MHELPVLCMRAALPHMKSPTRPRVHGARAHAAVGAARAQRGGAARHSTAAAQGAGQRLGAGRCADPPHLPEARIALLAVELYNKTAQDANPTHSFDFDDRRMTALTVRILILSWMA